jgi:ribosome hibernation promoting factor
MNLNVTGHHLEITPAIRDYLMAKLERISRRFDHVIDVSVIMSVDRLRQKIEATVHLRGKEIFVEVNHEDMYAAIDALADKLDRQVVRHNERRRAERHNDALKHLVKR